MGINAHMMVLSNIMPVPIVGVLTIPNPIRTPAAKGMAKML